MKYSLIARILMLIVFQIIFMNGVRAGEIMYGEDENIHDIERIEGTDYYLCYKTTTHFLIAGLYVENDGYVLRNENEHNRYILLDDEKIKELQGVGMLPNPLPKYSLGVWEYLFGYSLWLIIFGIIIIEVIRRFLSKK